MSDKQILDTNVKRVRCLTNLELMRINQRTSEIQALYDEYDEVPDDVHENLQRELQENIEFLESSIRVARKSGLRVIR